MGDVFPEKRKTKRDKKRKKRHGVYKRGGKYRSMNVVEGKKKD